MRIILRMAASSLQSAHSQPSNKLRKLIIDRFIKTVQYNLLYIEYHLTIQFSLSIIANYTSNDFNYNTTA